jgi:hypothetical protein
MTDEQLNRSRAVLYQDGTFAIFPRDTGTKAVKEKRKQGKGSRNFRIDKKKVRSASVALWRRARKKRVLFVTVTVPFETNFENEHDVQRAFTLWLKNLRQNRNLQDYVWIKEGQPKNDFRIHYHVLLGLPYCGIAFLQKAWESAVETATGYVHITHNSVRLGRRPVVRDVRSISNYLAKYMTKQQKDAGMGTEVETWNTRCYGYSETLSIAKRVDPMDLILLLEESGAAMYRMEPYMIAGRLNVEKCVDMLEYAFGDPWEYERLRALSRRRGSPGKDDLYIHTIDRRDTIEESDAIFGAYQLSLWGHSSK